MYDTELENVIQNRKTSVADNKVIFTVVINKDLLSLLFAKLKYTHVCCAQRLNNEKKKRGKELK